MRVPPFERYMRLLQSAGVLMLGMILGALVYNTLFQARVEALVNLQSELETKLAQYESDILQLNQNKKRYTAITSVVPRIEEESGARGGRPELDKVTEGELIRLIKEDMSVFIGRSIYDIDSDAALARGLLDRKIYSNVRGKDYTVEIKTALVADNKLQIWLQVRLYERPPA